MKSLKRCLGLSGTIILLSGCNSSEELSKEEVLSKYNINMYKLNRLVCDPFDDNTPENSNMGLHAELFYLDSTQPHYNDVQSYFDYGTRSNQHLFFSHVNVPTRLFNQGFPKETGDKILDDESNELHEYFALRYRSVLKLGANDEPGEYELALLSDDGTILHLRNNETGEMYEAVNNDGDHPTKMSCGSTTIQMDRDTEIFMQLDYYQGPRYHISVIPLWRKVENGNRIPENECGQLGNNRYFDYNNNSEPQAAYLGLLDRGWKPIAPENYNLPITTFFNPCVEGEAPTINDFNVEDYLDGQIRVTWNTDIPAASQVRYVNLNTGEEIITDSDNVLRLNHDERVSNLERGVPYLIQGISISGTYGKSISEPITIILQ